MFSMWLCSIVVDCTYPRKIAVAPVYSTGMFVMKLSATVKSLSHLKAYKCKHVSHFSSKQFT